MHFGTMGTQLAAVKDLLGSLHHLRGVVRIATTMSHVALLHELRRAHVDTSCVESMDLATWLFALRLRRIYLAKDLRKFARLLCLGFIARSSSIFVTYFLRVGPTNATLHLLVLQR